MILDLIKNFYTILSKSLYFSDIPKPHSFLLISLESRLFSGSFLYPGPVSRDPENETVVEIFDESSYPHVHGVYPFNKGLSKDHSVFIGINQSIPELKEKIGKLSERELITLYTDLRFFMVDIWPYSPFAFNEKEYFVALKLRTMILDLLIQNISKNFLKLQEKKNDNKS